MVRIKKLKLIFIFFLSAILNSYAGTISILPEILLGKKYLVNEEVSDGCIPESAKIGDILEAPNLNNTIKVLSISGKSAICNTLSRPILAKNQYTFNYRSKLNVVIPDDYEIRATNNDKIFLGIQITAGSKVNRNRGVTIINALKTKSDPASFVNRILEAQKNALNAGVVKNQNQFEKNGYKFWQAEVHGNSKSIFPIELVYLITVVEGESELVGITAFSTLEDYSKAKEELQSISLSVSGIQIKNQSEKALIGPLINELSLIKGTGCVPETANVGDTLISKVGNSMKIVSIIGNSLICLKPTEGILANVEYDFKYKPKFTYKLPVGYEEKPITLYQKYSGSILTASSKSSNGAISVKARLGDYDESEVIKELELLNRSQSREVEIKGSEFVKINGIDSRRFEGVAISKDLFDNKISFLVTILDAEKENIRVVGFSKSEEFNANKENFIKIAESIIGLEPKVSSQKLDLNQDIQTVYNVSYGKSSTQKKLALVIGNSKYKNNPLINPKNDADDISLELKRGGFQVIDVRDATLSQMRSALRQYGDKLLNSDVGLVYYSGHGLEAKGRNYFIPINADIQREDEISDQGLDVSLILEKMNTAQRGVNILIIDACRDNPFGRGVRSASRGMAAMDAPPGSIVAFSTSPGKVASDGENNQRNSPYTKNLLRAMKIPNLPIEQVFKDVRRSVQLETKNMQTPWENTSLTTEFYFRYIN